MKTHSPVFLLALCAAAPALAMPIDVGGPVPNPDCTFGCVDRMQQAYAASNFAGPLTISSVSFFVEDPNNVLTVPWNGATWQMSLSTSANPVGALSAIFASNVGGDVALFGSLTPIGTPSHTQLVTFTGSFPYDPGLGDLLVDVVRTSGGVMFSPPQPLRAGTAPGAIDRAYAFSSTTTADGFNQGGYALYTRFNHVVPEPASASLAAALMGVVTTRRRVR